MITHFIEATNFHHGGANWGKFLLAKFDAADWAVPAIEAKGPLLAVLPGKDRWNPETSIIVFDLQTMEGAHFDLRGNPTLQLERHKVWVCPLFEPFLAWLFEAIQTRPPGEGRFDITNLPHIARFAARSSLVGYRRAGA